MPIILAALARGPLGTRIRVTGGMVAEYSLDEILDCLIDMVANGRLAAFNADTAWETSNGTITLTRSES